MTTAHELILVDVLLTNEDGLLAVELLWYDKEVLLLHILFFLLFAAADEGHVLTPALTVLIGLVLAVQLVDVLLAQQYDLGA